MEKEPENTVKQTDGFATNRRICVIDGQRFSVVRHFEGDKDLDALMTEIAVRMANRDMGLRG